MRDVVKEVPWAWWQPEGMAGYQAEGQMTNHCNQSAR